MAPGSTKSRIVSEHPGYDTGDTYYQTKDGRWWRNVQCGDLRGTGDRWGIRQDGHVRDSN